MPPPGSHPQSNSGQNNSNNGEPYYSNDDVVILHEIVVLAQQLLPTLPQRERLPTNALFAAYYAVLPRLELDADHDSRYARVLFKIGNIRGQTTLAKKFEEVMSNMGINLEYTRTSGEEEEYSQTQDFPNEAGPSAQPPNPRPRQALPQEKKRGRPRRNSENSGWVPAIEPQSQTRTRPSSLSSITRLQPDGSIHQFVVPDDPTEPLEATSHDSQLEDSPRHDNRARLNYRSESRRNGRNVSVSTHRSVRIRRRSSSHQPGQRAPLSARPRPDSNVYQAVSEATAASSDYDYDSTPDHEQGLDENLPGEEDTNSILTSLYVDPGYHTRYIVRRILYSWREKAMNRAEDNGNMAIIAKVHKETSLVRSSVKKWQNMLLNTRRLAETRRFFDHLEQRSSRARDIYLMHIAFTHWTNFTNEHIERTALARRHIVRHRIFNAWRDITAVNELKVRRQVLKKFFGVWKGRHEKIVIVEATALQRYEAGLVKRVYRLWLHRIWDLAARNWREELLARQTLTLWVEASRNIAEIKHMAADARVYCLLFHRLKAWKGNFKIHIQYGIQADEHYINTLRRNQLRKWRSETRVVPARKVVQTDIAGRLLRNTLVTWRFRTRQEREATAWDRMKILREALTKWRHQARGQIVVANIDRRVVMKGFYMWTLAHRARALEEELNEKRRQESLQVWVYRCRTAREHRWNQEDIARSFTARKTQQQVLRHWYSSMESRQRHQLVSIDYRMPRLLHKMLSNWSAQAKQRSKLQKWANDAQFYTLASKSLKKWKASTEVSIREKRRAAFGQVKRTVKTNLARGALLTWRQKSQHIWDIKAQAIEASQNRNVVIGMNIFDRWRARTEEVAELESIWREDVLRKKILLWGNRSNAIQALAQEADVTYQERRQSRTLKKWSLTILQKKAQSFYAQDVCEKNAKRTFRKMFNYWRQKARQQRPPAVVEEEEQNPQLGETIRVEAWSDFGEEDVRIEELAEELNEAQAASSIPGYLSTPSKRSERVLAVAARFSTTPRAPLSTPFERQLRAQWSGGLAPSSRRTLARSRLAFSEGFADIEEGSRELG